MAVATASISVTPPSTTRTSKRLPATTHTKWGSQPGTQLMFCPPLRYTGHKGTAVLLFVFPIQEEIPTIHESDSVSSQVRQTLSSNPRRSFLHFWAVHKGWQRPQATSSSKYKSCSLQKTQCKYDLVKNSGSNRAEAEIPEDTAGTSNGTEMFLGRTQRKALCLTSLLGSLEEARILFAKCPADVRGAI